MIFFIIYTSSERLNAGRVMGMQFKLYGHVFEFVLECFWVIFGGIEPVCSDLWQFQVHSSLFLEYFWLFLTILIQVCYI